MTTLTEGMHAGEFLVGEASVGSTGVSRSRDVITVLSGQNLVAGAVIAKVTASGKYVERANNADSAVDGSETAVGILFDAVDASAADAAGVIIARDAEFNGTEVTYKTGNVAQDVTDGTAELLAVGIIAR